MTPTAIRVNNIGKEYRLGQLMNTYRTLRESITEQMRKNKQTPERDNYDPKFHLGAS